MPETSATLIDHIYVKLKLSEINDKSVTGNFLTDITDHLPNFLLLGTPSKDVIQNRPFIRIYNERNLSSFQADLTDIDWISEFEGKSLV